MHLCPVSARPAHPPDGDGGRTVNGQEHGHVVVDIDGLDALMALLRSRGHRVLGPTVRDGAVVIGDLASSQDLPRGWHDEQGPGRYRLQWRGDEELFGWAVGPSSVKAQVFPPTATVWRAEPDDVPVPTEPDDDAAPVALVGVRPCETVALGVLDKVLGPKGAADPGYERRRRPMIVITAECGSPAGTCFCTSMGNGPAASEGFDLAITELLDDQGQRFLIRIGSPVGATLVEALPSRAAGPDDEARRDSILASAAGRMGRFLDTDGLAALLARNIEHPRWDDVAERCLACGNCTLVCPTCFCSTVEDVSDLDGGVERHRSWSSCFDLGHSYLHGGPVRATTRARYRQWMTHKLSTWWDQFGTSGCVGCGRCIAWCPVGIDITEEAAAIRASDGERRTPGVEVPNAG